MSTTTTSSKTKEHGSSVMVSKEVTPVSKSLTLDMPRKSSSSLKESFPSHTVGLSAKASSCCKSMGAMRVHESGGATAVMRNTGAANTRADHAVRGCMQGVVCLFLVFAGRRKTKHLGGLAHKLK